MSIHVENDPLMEEGEEIDGDLWLTGNRTLISLNLSSIYSKLSTMRSRQN